MAAPQGINTCSTCQYWDQIAVDPNILHAGSGLTVIESVRRMCRRYPAVVYKAPEEWCGEYSKAPPGNP